ncbi:MULTISPECIES: helix-turn-helix domain-containing protein [unclassified Pseudomonas]|uniref:helix-turn-helix domain-containing protein n=1 Tax=unclassified Pseudomonas TaxID=196821 RepID=UPI000B8801B3|nr:MULTISPECIES: helix-turn-helix transcriptional regulator [unclassified Pseudomonas]NRH44057.1 helix-turn-helix transcriptional regulator [Pseudomonas sp. MS15a(2019)]
MNESLRVRFGRRIKELRLATGQSQEAFADTCGFARSYMSRMERGEGNPSLDAIERLAVVLGIPEADLFVTSETSEARPARQDLSPEVPYASDGSCFHPGLASSRDGKFKVGEKDAPKRFATFDEALEYLRGMSTAKWWRPNSQGNPGLVSAVEWKKLTETSTPKK